MDTQVSVSTVRAPVITTIESRWRKGLVAEIAARRIGMEVAPNATIFNFSHSLPSIVELKLMKKIFWQQTGFQINYETRPNIYKGETNNDKGFLLFLLHEKLIIWIIVSYNVGWLKNITLNK